jgi:hypothetical protein
MAKKFSAAAQVDIGRIYHGKYDSHESTDLYPMNITLLEYSDDVSSKKSIPYSINTLTIDHIKNIVLEAMSKKTLSADNDAQNHTKKIGTQSEIIGIFDFLNQVRGNIADRDDARFKTLDEFIEYIMTTARHIKTLGHFRKIYLVTKSFCFGDDISYYDVLRIILWSFCHAVPEWKKKICLVLVNGLNDSDREADDRALFVLYDELSILFNPKRIIIFSDDNLESIKSHFFSEVTLNFYFMETMSGTWFDSKIKLKENRKYQQDKDLILSTYEVVHPNTNDRYSIIISP